MADSQLCGLNGYPDFQLTSDANVANISVFKADNPDPNDPFTLGMTTRTGLGSGVIEVKRAFFDGSGNAIAGYTIMHEVGHISGMGDVNDTSCQGKTIMARLDPGHPAPG